MEPVTHMLTGAVLARTGFNRRAAYATTAMLMAAELPDIDTVWGYAGGPVVGLEHHRGITHTFVAAPLEAAAVTLAFYAWHRWRKRATAAPANWLWLFLGCWLALLSHLLLDWTNNYGIRPFFPFNPRWYAGSFVFIFEPVLFLLLVGGLVMPVLFGLINSEVGERERRFRGRGWAVAALVGVAVLYGVRFEEHGRALDIAAQNEPAGTTRLFASPHPLTPFTWSVVADTPEFYQLSTVDTRRGVVVPGTPEDNLYKPAVSLPILAAKRTFLGRIYLDWSMYPVISEQKDNSDPNHALDVVSFADARFMYNSALSQGRTHPAVSGTVTLDMEAPEGDRMVETKMGKRIQR